MSNSSGRNENNVNGTTSSSAILTETKPMVDVTDLFREAAASLTVKDSMLCNKESFSLQDSMAALEIMDPKMDCCEIPASYVAPFGRRQATIEEGQEERKVFPRPSPIGLDDVIDPLPWDDLTLQDAAYIALECLVRLESLLGGASVVESTFTCLYAHEPVVADMKARLVVPADASMEAESSSPSTTARGTISGTTAQRVVYSSILLLLELTDVIRGIILNADIYEEEDFTVSTYGIIVFEDRDENVAMIAAQLALEGLSMENDKNSDVGKAINLMIGFQLDLLKICASMARLAGKAVTKQVEQAQKLARVAASKLEELLPLTKKLKENELDATKALLKRTFDSYVTRPLVGNAPVRKVVFTDAVLSISSLTKITKELDWALCGLMLRGTSIGRLRRMLAHLSVSAVNILSRSLIVLNLYFDDKLFGLYPLPERIMQHMQQLSHVPDEIFQTNASRMFLNRLAKPLYDVLKVMLLNRNRQRTYIEAVMFPDWAALNQEAQLLDATMMKDVRFGAPQPHFNHYTLYLTLDLMDHFVALGLELELLRGDFEIAAAFWYRDFLLSGVINQLAAMRQFKAEAKQQAAAAAAATSSKRGKKKGGKNQKKNQTNGSQRPEPEDVEDEFEFWLVNLKRILCRGIVRFLAAVDQSGLVPETSYEFTSKERIFHKRFEAFEPIQQPPLLGYQDYLAGSDSSKVPPHDLLASTAEMFQAAKSYVDRLFAQCPMIHANYLAIPEEELKRLAKVTIGNSVYVQKLRQLVEATPPGTKVTGRVEYDLETHRHFCTIKIS